MTRRGYYPRPPQAERFWSKVDQNGPVPAHRPELGRCWLWTGGRDADGYGHFWVTAVRRTGRAHQAAWLLLRGAIPEGLSVCHHCDNPPCVNPDHLWLGTTRQNLHDRDAKGRGPTGDRNGSRRHPERYPRGERHPAAKLSDADVEQIRRRYAAGGISQDALAHEYRVGQAQVSRITRRASRRD